MGLTSLQVCMDTSDWFQQNGVHEGASGSSSPPSGEMIPCSSRPGMATERGMRPPHEQALKCPRCDSTHTKFCYYNNYSLSQPRYFCKTCRRYWTKGGTLRNVPVGGGCRKNKKVTSSSKKGVIITPPDQTPHSLSPSSVISPITSTDLHLSTFSHGIPSFTSFNPFLDNSDVMECKVAAGDSMSMLGDHMITSLNDSKLDLMMGSSVSSSHTGYYYSNRINADESFGGIHGGSCNIPFGFTMGPVGSEVYHHESFPSVHNGSEQRLMQLQSFGGTHDHHANSTVETKPSSSLLALEWHGHDHQANSYAAFGKDSMRFNPMNGIGAWPGMMNIDGA